MFIYAKLYNAKLAIKMTQRGILRNTSVCVFALIDKLGKCVYFYLPVSL